MTATDGGAAADPSAPGDVGSVTLHRLNAVEYDNTVRDLLGATTHPSSVFPPDDGAYGFDNIADTLTISPILFEQYDLSADKLAADAIHNPDIMTCDPAQTGVDACAAQILGPFLQRAWRRRISPDEIATAVQIGSTNTLSFEERIQLAIKAALLSPDFLFRVESDPATADGTPHALNDYELASRLSYFLWSSMPDDALLRSRMPASSRTKAYSPVRCAACSPTPRLRR